jgi:hypothetical protein
VIAEPPFDDGAVQATATVVGLVPPPVVRVTPLGVPGGARVVADADADAAPVPTALTAVTVTEYVVPAASPVMVQLVAGGVAVQEPDGLAVTVYPVRAEPPVDAGADHEAAIEPLPGVRDRLCGRDGTVVPLGVTDADPDAGPVPAAFVAVTVTV